MASIEANISISSKLFVKSRPSIAALEIFKIKRSKGIIIGNESMAISMALFSAFEAIPATRLRVEAKPMAPNMIQAVYQSLLATGLPIKTEYVPKANKPKTINKIELKIIFERITDSADVSV